jgi:hypothetical protein
MGGKEGKLTSAYFELVMNEFRATMPRDDGGERAELGEAIMNTVLGLRPTVISKKPTRKWIFVGNKIFQPMGEIFNSLWAIENIAIYVRSFPYKRRGILPLNYLQYHIENYLNEIYILKTRLISYLNTLEKAYSKTKQGRIVAKKLKPLRLLVDTAFKAYTEKRGSHVHVSRFKDEDIDRLSTLQVLSISTMILVS